MVILRIIPRPISVENILDALSADKSLMLFDIISVPSADSTIFTSKLNLASTRFEDVCFVKNLFDKKTERIICSSMKSDCGHYIL